MSNFDLRKYLAEGRLYTEAGGDMQSLPVDPIPGTAELFSSIKDKLMASGEEIINKIPKDQLMAMKSAAEKVLGPGFGKEDITINNAKRVGKILVSQLNEGNIADTIGGILTALGFGAAIYAYGPYDIRIMIAGLIAVIIGYIIMKVRGSDSDYEMKKQMATAEPLRFLSMYEYTPGFDEIKNSRYYKYKVVYYKDKEGKQPFAQTIFKNKPNYDGIFAVMNSKGYDNKKDVQLIKAFDASGKEYPLSGSPKDVSLSTLKALGFREKPKLTWQPG